MALIDKEIIRAEIERRIESCIKNVNHRPCHRIEELCELLGFLDTLPEQPVLPGTDEQGIPGRDYIPVEWVDACEKYGRWKIVQKVKSASDDLEKEIEDYIEGCLGGLEGQEIASCARYFYELGCRHTAVMYDEIEYNRQRTEEAELSEDLEEEIKRWIHAQRNNGRKLFGWIDMVELAARHFAEWGAEHLKR